MHVCASAKRFRSVERPSAQLPLPIIVVVSQVEGVTAAYACGVGCVLRLAGVERHARAETDCLVGRGWRWW
jgi:hypothetical protein